MGKGLSMQQPHNLRNKKILLLGPAFYGYLEAIKAELVQLGADVLYIETSLWDGGRYSKCSKLKKFIHKFRRPFYEERITKCIYQQAKNFKPDILFVVAVYPATTHLISSLKQMNPNIKTYIYFWDSFSTWDYSYLLPLFDKCFSFEIEDCNKFKELEYLPLFWQKKQIRDKDSSEIYDIAHIGTLCPQYKNRAYICTQINKIGKDIGLNNYLYLYYNESELFSKISLKNIIRFLIGDEHLKFYYKVIKRVKGLSEIVHSEPLDYSTVNYVENSAKAILDINMDRSGLAMRIIGALANGKKIITNNKKIIHNKFFNESRIHIIDDKNPQISIEWLNSPSEEIDMSYLRIDNWLKTIFNI